MIGDTALPEILGNKSNRVRKQWIDDRIERLKGINVADRNLKVSKLIDKLNKKIKG